MSRLVIPQPIIAAIEIQAQNEAPNEACGILGGIGETVLTQYPMTNADKSPDHFTLVPAEQFSVIRKLRAAGQTMLAVYHSHPASPARPSEEDIRLAFASDVVYVILSLEDPDAADIRGFYIENNLVTSVPIEIVAETTTRKES